MRLACDTGGTFTDLVVEHDDQIKLFKASTTPDDPVRGVLDAIQLAANHYGVTRRELLTRASAFMLVRLGRDAAAQRPAGGVIPGYDAAPGVGSAR